MNVRQVNSMPVRAVGDQAYQIMLDQLLMPAVLFDRSSSQIQASNQTFRDFFAQDEQIEIEKHPLLERMLNEAQAVSSVLSNTLIVNHRTIRCITTPVRDEMAKALIFFEDISSEAQSEKNTALLYHLSLSLSTSSLSLKEKLQTAVGQILFEVEAYDCSVLLYDPVNQVLRPYAWGCADMTSSMDGSSSFKLGEGIAGFVAKQQKPLVVPNVLEDPRFVRRERDVEPVALLCLPLVNEGKFFGVLSISRRPGSTFADGELQLFITIAGRLAALIQSESMDEAMLNERTKLQQIQDTLADGTILYDPSMKILLANKAAEKILGFKQSIVGRHWDEILGEGMNRHSSYRLERNFDVKKAFARVMKTGKPITGSGTIISSPPRIIDITLAPVYDRQHRLTGVLSHFTDVTEIRSLQQKTEDRVRQLTNLFKISSVTGVDVSTIIQKILTLTLPLVDVSACRLYMLNQHTNQLVLKKNIGDSSAMPQPEHAYLDKLNQIVSSCKGETFKLKRGRDSQEILAVPILGQHSACLGVIVVSGKRGNAEFNADDARLLSMVAARVAMKIDNARLLAQVEDSRKRLEAIIDQSVDGILVTSPDQKIEIWNRALERLTGVKEKEARGQLVTILRDSFPDYEEFRHDDILEIRYSHKKTGATMWLGVAWSSIFSGDSVTGHVAILRDISRQKELEAAKNEFVATASHELRSPLTAIVGYLSMLKRGDAGQIINTQQAFFVDKAYQNAKRMVSLVEDILMTTRMDAGQIRYRKEHLDLVAIIDSVLTDLRFKAEEKHLRIGFDKAAAKPVFADQDGVHQVVTNLLNNAVKYTPNGGRILVHFELQKEGSKSVLVTAITDTGVGIEAGDYRKIFEKFGRVDNPLSVAAGGTGLGLYITKTIVEDLGGKIWVKSTKGKGSTFYFSLPLAERVGRERKQ